MKKQKDFIRTIQMRILAERGIGNPLYMLLHSPRERKYKGMYGVLYENKSLIRKFFKEKGDAHGWADWNYKGRVLYEIVRI